jgi:hypothetical protein
MNKKLIVFSSAIVMLLSSCSELVFKNAMPQNAQNLTAFPEVLQGTFVSTDDVPDTVRVTPTYYGIEQQKLDDENVIRQAGRYYVLNQKKLNGWHVAVIKPNGKNSFSCYLFDTKEDKSRKAISKVTRLEEVLNGDGEVDYLRIAPTDAEFKKLLRSRALIRVQKYKRISA